MTTLETAIEQSIETIPQEKADTVQRAREYSTKSSQSRGRTAHYLQRAESIAASALLVATLPLTIPIAGGIYLTTKRSPFFTQNRVGEGGQPFRLVKFQTMRPQTESAWQSDNGENTSAFKNMPKDADVYSNAFTKVLNRTHLDELPQLVNIARGEMSFVGPRPYTPCVLESLHDEFGDRTYRILQSKPGYISESQLRGRDNIPDAQRLQLDRKQAVRSAHRPLRTYARTILSAPIIVSKRLHKQITSHSTN